MIMTRRRRPPAMAAWVTVLACGVGAANAQYDYGKGRYERDGEPGIFLLLEGGLANPRNTDNVVAATSGNVSPIIPAWDDDPAGRIGIGYELASGDKISLTFWGFETDTRGTGTGSFDFTIGPPFESSGSILGDSGTDFDIKTEISAMTVDAAWGRTHAASRRIDLDWSAGLRYANYEEEAGGFYFDGQPLDASKSNEGEMIGARLALRGTYRLTYLSFGAGVGFSFLDGELTASSGLKRASVSQQEGFAELKDDGRSGQIREFDIVASWHGANDRVRISLGWEQSTWEGIADDLMRNLPGTVVTLRDRDSVVFSGYKLGLLFRF